MCVAAKGSPDERVVPMRQYRRLRRPLGAVLHQAGLNELDGVGAYLLPRAPAFDQADIVHCHALQGSWFSYPAIRTAAGGKPVVLTLHDMWPFTGHCSFSFDCERWQTGCGRCPHLDTYPAVPRDATRIEWRVKRWTWSGAEPAVVAPSKWMAGMVRQSMLNASSVHVIPHGIDTGVYAPRDPSACKRAFGLDEKQLVIMFAAASVDDTRKGADLVAGTMQRLNDEDRARCNVLLMGGGDGTMSRALRKMDMRVTEFGYVISDTLKASIYSAADLFIFPTRADNAPLVVLESLACGTPVMTFAIGGLPEMIEHTKTGFLCPAEDTVQMAATITSLLNDRSRLARMRTSCREIVEARYENRSAALRHLALYRRLLSAGRSDTVPPDHNEVRVG